MRTRTERRFGILFRAGFLKEEAKILSEIPFGIPYMKELYKERKKDYEDSKVAKVERFDFAAIIRSKYRDNGWLKDNGDLDVWDMLRACENRYRVKHPSYDSPWEKNRNERKDYIATLNKPLARREPVSAYARAKGRA